MSERKERRETNPGQWRGVDPKIWAYQPSRGRLRQVVLRLREALVSSSLWILIIGGPLAVLATFMGAYYLGGPTLFGPALLGIWSILIVSFVLVMERTGFARNFESWDFPLTRNRLLALPIALGAFLAIIYIVLYAWKP